MVLDNIDKKLLNLAQKDFPLKLRPYYDLALKLGIDEDEVIRRLGQIKADKLIRQISPVIDARRIGYQTTLVAMKVPDENLENAEQIIAQHPGVSHGYERNHHFNVWFTLSIPPDADVTAELQRINAPIQAEAVFALPALKLFKIEVYFNMDGEDGNRKPNESSNSTEGFGEIVKLSLTEKQVINALQQDLSLVSHPFSDMAADVGMDVEAFLVCCASLKSRGIIRRFGASMNHRKAGFMANAMTCWIVPPEKVEALGQKLASLTEVSHCYERQTNPLWQHNVFAMIHGYSPGDCQKIADEVSDEFGVHEKMLLYSTKEFKKARIKYLV